MQECITIPFAKIVRSKCDLGLSPNNWILLSLVTKSDDIEKIDNNLSEFSDTNKPKHKA